MLFGGESEWVGGVDVEVHFARIPSLMNKIYDQSL